MWSRTLFGALCASPAVVPVTGGGGLSQENPPELRLVPVDHAVGAAEAKPARAPGRPGLRDRYIAARFMGVARGTSELRCVPAIVKAARLYFEEDRADLAVELLELAAEELPHESAYPLAQLEILYLAREKDAFVELAQRFRSHHAGSEHWPQVERLGRKLAPGQTPFGQAERARDHDHYGPWPDLPNWVQAAWDLTAEVAAADFHQAVRRAAAGLAAAACCNFALDGAP